MDPAVFKLPACRRRGHVTSSNKALLRALLLLFSTTARYNLQTRFFPSQIGSHIHQTQDLPLWTADMPCRPPCQLQCPLSGSLPPLKALSRAQGRRRRSGRKGPIRWAITPPFFMQNSQKLGQMSAIQLSSWIPISIYFPKILLSKYTGVQYETWTTRSSSCLQAEEETRDLQ